MGAWSVHPAPLLILSQCFLSLSLELVLRYQLGTLAHLMPGASRRRQAALPVPAAAGAPARYPPLIARRPSAYLTRDSCCPALRGLSARGVGSRRDCVLPSAPAPETPPPHQATSRSTLPPVLKTPEAIAGPHRPGRLVCSCIKLSRVPSSHHPSVSSSFFSPSLPLPPPAPSSLGSAQVNGSPPRLHGSPAHVTFPSRFFLCVYLSYFPSFLPFSFPLPLLPCNWRLCNEFANSWTVRLLFFQIFLSASPPLLSPFLSFILSLDH